MRNRKELGMEKNGEVGIELGSGNAEWKRMGKSECGMRNGKEFGMRKSKD